MPELPNVETLKKYIGTTSLNKKIINVEIKNTKILENISKEKIIHRLKRNKFVHTYRHGKYIFIKTNRATWLILHFGMTGYIKYFKNLDDESSHTRLLITFDNNYHLAYYNQRLFGKISFTNNKEKYITQKTLGVDALNLDYNGFKELMANRRSKIKPILINQQLISGIGNIYADEVLFQSGIHPETKINNLSPKKIKDIYMNIKEVLQIAIKAKANPDNFPDKFIIPHRKRKGVCPKGNEELKTIKINGRTTYFCPVHQKLE